MTAKVSKKNREKLKQFILNKNGILHPKSSNKSNKSDKPSTQAGK
jgi:hypothetical protein